MRRGVGIVLVGLGVFFVALALLLRFYVVPSLLVTPIDQFAESFAPGTGTVFNPATLVEEDNVDMVAHRTLRGMWPPAATTSASGTSPCCSRRPTGR